MEGTNALSDAEMRLITINGQTIMLEGDFQNLNMTNEFLNEMLMVSTSKVDLNNDRDVEVNESSCNNCVKEEDEATKLEISVQGENELQTIQIGVEEAKALGLYFYGVKTEDDVNVWDQCSSNGAGEETVKSDEARVNEETETCKVKFHSVPVLSVSCLDREQGNLITLNDIKKGDGVLETPTETYSLNESSKLDELVKSVQDDNPESLPAIGHLEGFQIPTSEDGVLLPATVNAKMADGSYQTITLIPQVVNGTVTYTVHFSNVVKDFLDENTSSPLTDPDNVSECYNGVNAVKEEMTENAIISVNSFLNSINSVKQNCVKNALQESVQKPSSDKTILSGLINSLPDESFLKVNKNSAMAGGSDVWSLNYLVQDQLPIETKIDNLISENESVISKCKKVRYGKKVKVDEAEESIHDLNKISKNNITKAKKVKLKGKGGKLSNEESDKKNFKLSLLKPNNNQRLNTVSGNGLEAKKPSNSMPHMNLNGRLEYPNLKAIDETASSLPYLKVKSSNATKQPYFNVLPYPKDKIIPVQKQVLPLNCDLQQAKNLISLQKFLETQKLQLKIQPLVTNGNKIINIRPKPSQNDDGKMGQVSGDSNLGQISGKDKSIIQEAETKAQEDESLKKGFQESLNVSDVLLNDGKLNCLKFLKPAKSESGGGDGGGETEKEISSNCSNKMNGIFIKNNPEYFSQKVKDGKADEHPLGSSENPIQLVQTGHTFHSRQPLSESQLRQIASILQKQKFDSPNVKKNSIFDPKTNTRIVYRVVYPEDVDLNDVDRTSLEGITRRKRGRHRGKTMVDDERSSNLMRGPGRPKKNPWYDDDLGEEEIEDMIPKRKIPRTRSGRLSRPPRYMDKDYKRLKNSEGPTEKAPNSKCDSNGSYTAYKNGKKVSVGKMDKTSNMELDKSLMTGTKQSKGRSVGQGFRTQPRTKRNFKPENRCPTCQKVYLGPTRMMWHLSKFPDHCNLEKYKENCIRKRNETKARRAARRLNLCDVTDKIKQVLISLPKEEMTTLCGPILAEALTIWDFFLLRINLLKESRKDEVDAMLHELVTLLEKLTRIAEDIFLPVFTKEAEKDEDCVEIDRMEVAIALGLPVGFYKINNDNLSLLRFPFTTDSDPLNENEDTSKEEGMYFENDLEDSKGEFFEEKSSDSWEKEKSEKLEDEPFWLENKTEDGDGWHRPEEEDEEEEEEEEDEEDEEEDSSMKTLSTKFEPNLSTKILDSSNDSIDDGKYEEPAVRLIDLESNSKDVEQSNSSGNMDESPEINLVKDCAKMSEKEDETEASQEKSSPELWNENSTDKVSAELWNENSGREKWDDTSDMVPAKSSTELWTSENSDMSGSRDKAPGSHLWNENSNLTASEKVDETNSVFLESLLSVQNSSEFLSNSGEGFLAENIGLINDKEERLKTAESDGSGSKEKSEWRSDNAVEESYMRVWNAGKNPSWQKEESILSGSLQERMPGMRTTGRLTSTPESNGTMSFSIPNRRNSISDFTNINLEPANLDIVLPPAKSLIKDCLKDEEGKFEMKDSDGVSGSFLETSSNFKVKTWETDAAKPNDFVSANVNSEDLMKIALESLTSQHDVINVPPSSFDSAMGILNQSQEQGNLNLFASSETDALDFNLPLPDHLLRSNFNTGTFQTTCASNFQPSQGSPTFLSQTNNIFGTTCTLSNSMKFDQFEANYSDKKSKSLDEVMDFFEEKNSFNGYETCTGNGGSNFSFPSGSDHGNQYSVVDGHERAVAGEAEDGVVGKGSGVARKNVGAREGKNNGTGTTKVRGAKKQSQKSPRSGKVSKKPGKVKKAVDYPKTKTIESIINEALFDSCSSNGKTLQMENSSPNGGSSLPNGSENYSLPIIPESLDEVENLDFLNQD